MPSKRLALVRHAKSSWADPRIPDHGRPLSDRGRRAAALVGRYLRQARRQPDLVLCSSAVRARQTLELLELADDVAVEIEDELYGASASSILARLRRLPGAVASAMVIAHNPGVEDLARVLSEDGLARVEKFPTAAVADFSLPIRTWKELGPGIGRLHDLVIARRLG